MIEIKNIYYTNGNNYSPNDHGANGWAILLTKKGLYMEKAEVEIILIESHMIFHYISQSLLNQIIIVELNLFCKPSSNYIQKIDLIINQELSSLIQLLFTRFETRDRTYVVNPAIEIIIRKAFRLNLSTLKEYFEIFKLIAFIQENLSGNVTVSDLAEFMHMSKPTLNRFCMNKLNKVPQDLINDIKITLAKNLLESTDEKIFEIGEKAGFFNASAFTIFFKKETGLSPKEYRQNYFNSWKEHSLTI
ncbi:helix-turn-helix domain-containing protein [Enterococcus casseliflavus]|uniref:helix-turn-helix domain-containing protein n=1 Tax=Enterococcus casseliflavus TaxID=37734 RepID=UPI0011A52DED|nr:AraC family transcriptional regulator [Enterococcus casseliflavus]